MRFFFRQLRYTPGFSLRIRMHLLSGFPVSTVPIWRFHSIKAGRKPLPIFCFYSVAALHKFGFYAVFSTTANFLKACFSGVIDMHYSSRVYGNLLFFSYQLLYIQLSHASVWLPSASSMGLLFLKLSRIWVANKWIIITNSIWRFQPW